MKLPPRVERRVRISRALLFWEELLPALWPAAAVIGLFIALALFGTFSRLPLSLHWALLAGFGAAVVWLIWRGFRGFRWPGRDEALRHLEKSSGLSHAPLSSYEDVAAENTGDPALWAAHRRWISERIARLRIGFPVSVLALRDPYAIRAAVALLLVIGLIGTGAGRLDRLTDALLPGFFFRSGAAIAVVSVTAAIWIVSPDVGLLFCREALGAYPPLSCRTSPPQGGRSDGRTLAAHLLVSCLAALDGA